LNFLRLLAGRLSASCVSNVLAGNPQKQDIFTSCGSLRVLASQEVLAPLLARALFLGCTVSSGCQDIYDFMSLTILFFTSSAGNFLYP